MRVAEQIREKAAMRTESLVRTAVAVETENMSKEVAAVGRGDTVAVVVTVSRKIVEVEIRSGEALLSPALSVSVLLLT